MNLLRICVWVGCLAGLLFSGIFLNQLFALSGMSEACVLLFVVFSFATESAFRYLSLFIEKLQKGYLKLRRKV